MGMFVVVQDVYHPKISSQIFLLSPAQTQCFCLHIAISRQLAVIHTVICIYNVCF
jgi:hypothetical protein